MRKATLARGKQNLFFTPFFRQKITIVIGKIQALVKRTGKNQFRSAPEKCAALLIKNDHAIIDTLNVFFQSAYGVHPRPRDVVTNDEQFMIDPFLADGLQRFDHGKEFLSVIILSAIKVQQIFRRSDPDGFKLTFIGATRGKYALRRAFKKQPTRQRQRQRKKRRFFFTRPSQQFNSPGAVCEIHLSIAFFEERKIAVGKQTKIYFRFFLRRYDHLARKRKTRIQHVAEARRNVTFRTERIVRDFPFASDHVVRITICFYVCQPFYGKGCGKDCFTLKAVTKKIFRLRVFVVFRSHEHIRKSRMRVVSVLRVERHIRVSGDGERFFLVGRIFQNDLSEFPFVSVKQTDLHRRMKSRIDVPDTIFLKKSVALF